MNKKEQSKISRYMSKLLRHDPEDLEISNDGYVKVSALKQKLGINQEQLDEIVDGNDKQRFEYKGHKHYIKAIQGHSNKEVTKLKLDPIDNKNLELYHGTSSEFSGSIMKHGLLKMSRLHLHWQTSYKGAMKRAKQKVKGKHVPVIWKLDIEKYEKVTGNTVQRSANNVFLTDDVPFECLVVAYRVGTRKIDSSEATLQDLINKYKDEI